MKEALRTQIYNGSHIFTTYLIIVQGNHHSSILGDDEFDDVTTPPFEDPGVKPRMCPPYTHHIKRVAQCRCLDGHIKEPYEISMAFGARA